jgi:hypothetical protein
MEADHDELSAPHSQNREISYARLADNCLWRSWGSILWPSQASAPIMPVPTVPAKERGLQRDNCSTGR